MSSQLEMTSAILGEYMLKGWTLTDLHCDQCRTTPLMREPQGSASAANRSRIQFCALCDGGPSGRGGSNSMVAPISNSTTSPVGTISSNLAPNSSSSLSIPVPTSQSASSSSDAAAQSISDLLLRGYSLLDANCPNSTCRGIPLVGYPRKKDGSRDSRRECVSCGGRWVDENDLANRGGGGLVPVDSSKFGVPVESTVVGMAGMSDAWKGMTTGLQFQSDSDRNRMLLYDMVNEMRKDEKEGRSIQDAMPVDDPIPPVASSYEEPTPATTTSDPTASLSSNLISAINRTTTSLTSVLNRLSTSLDNHGLKADTDDTERARYFVDLKLHTEAIKDVLEVLALANKAGKGL